MKKGNVLIDSSVVNSIFKVVLVGRAMRKIKKEKL